MRAPHPLLWEILYQPQFEADRVEVLPWLLRIDAAHVVMLARCGILAPVAAGRLLTVNRQVAARAAAGGTALDPEPSHRGLYLVYESHLIARLGSEIGGAGHVARSRNDINASVTRLRLRQALLSLLDAGAEMLAAAIACGEQHRDTLISGFSHQQPAQPSTLGHYLAAVTSELARGVERLEAAFEEVNRSPLGAGAGQGTSFPIDRELTAALLGFDGPVASSLDAVASRDYALLVLADLAILGSTLTRLASDFQSWGSVAYGFLSWPEELVSTSSMMPQKRNAFVFENIRGQAARPAGAFTACLLDLKGTSFANTVEVSSEATSHLWPALAAAQNAVRLTTLMLEGAEANAVRMRQFLASAETTMTALADYLVAAHGLAFRTAHDVVTATLRHAQPGEPWSPAALRQAVVASAREVAGRALAIDESDLAAVLDPWRCSQAAVHGGGPAAESVDVQLRGLAARRLRLASATARRRADLAAAERRLDQEMATLLESCPDTLPCSI